MKVRTIRTPLLLLSSAISITAIVLLIAALTGCGSVGVTQNLPVAPITVPPPNNTQSAPPVVVQQTPPPDETAAIQALLDKGGIVQLDARTYHTTKTLVESVSHTTLRGKGAATVIEFTPPPIGSPRGVCTTDRVITPRCGLAYSAPLPIAASIAVGDTSFEALNAADVAGLAPGDWVILTLSDPGIADATSHTGYPTSVDWMQVASVVGTRVNVQTPFRMAFTNSIPFVSNSTGLGFVHAILTEGVAIEDLTIKVDANTAGAVGIYVLGTIGTTISNVTINDETSDPLYIEQAKGLTVTGCNITGGKTLNEFAESIEVVIENSTFSSQGVALALDLGTGYFRVEGNRITQKCAHRALRALPRARRRDHWQYDR